MIAELALALQIILHPAPHIAPIACSGCSCRGGPGYRKPNGKCASWKELNRACGTPPETRCTDERDGKRKGIRSDDSEEN